MWGAAMSERILVLNAGSSSIKFSLFAGRGDGALAAELRGKVERLGGDGEPHLVAHGPDGELAAERTWPASAYVDHGAALRAVLELVDGTLGGRGLAGVGHRVVHGGTVFDGPALVTDEVLARLQTFVPLAPLHQPHNLSPIRALRELLPDVPQVACFDTSFHRTAPPLFERFAIPEELHEAGLRRYGFHGLSYQHVAEALPALDPAAAAGRTVALHLGNGASLCALQAGRSLGATMGFSVLDGLVMGTRCGSIDPGALLWLSAERGMRAKEIEGLLYDRSGLLGVSGLSSDMRTLLASADPRARLAVDLFVHRIRRELGAAAAALGGLDALVFTGGIGENAPEIRARVCRDAAWAGVELDPDANAAGGPRVSAAGSRASAWVVRADEELTIARQARALLDRAPPRAREGSHVTSNPAASPGAAALSAYGPARATVTERPLAPEEVRRIDAFWRACNYLAAGMIYLRDNPLLREPLRPEHVKNRLLGHWGASPALSFAYAHLNRLIRLRGTEVLFMAGPGHGAPGVLGPVYLEGTYSEVYPDRSLDEEGLRRFFRQFSFPGGVGSHCTPETPGSIHEGGELGYVLSHACGAAFDNPDLVVAAVVGDGEAETGPLATSWHVSKFLNPIRDGAVLPILSLNGYKIDNPTLLARIGHDELEALLRGAGWTPFFVEGSEPESMHQAMAATLDRCVELIRGAQLEARRTGVAARPRWPAIVLRTPKGWTAPAELDGHRLEGSWRAHQVPIPRVKDDPARLALLERWMRSYQPEELFDASGAPVPLVREAAPRGERRMGASPHANGGVLKKALLLPDFRDYAAPVPAPGESRAENTRPLGTFLRDVMRQNPTRFRLFGPDETSSNRLDAVYEASRKLWLAERFPEDEDGGRLAPDGRVVEMLSEHTLEGMLEGYLLTGRHGLLSTYEAFVHIIDSMFNQHAKWLSICNQLSWREEIASLNLLVTSTVWRQDHNGFTHQDPGFLDVVVNKSAAVTRIYLPPDANCLLSVADHCLRSEDYVNVIVADKQAHLQYLPMDAAITHCAKGLGIWDWASSDEGAEPDVVMACAGDVATLEALAATALLREAFPDLKLRFVNVVDLFTLQPDTEHPHGLSDRDFDSLFTTDRPIIFNFHGYPWLIHRLAYRRRNHPNLHVRGYKEKGSIDTPLELAIDNQIDRFSLAMDVIDRVPRLRATGAHAKERLRNRQLAARMYAHEHGVDAPDDAGWTWPGGRLGAR
ncbi:acetate kinase [Anaeromyxobacter dehalogenans 2CP-C]|uniref:Multifunctional fusion protein n=2 Tax=Anaeromyxobacter dehalogenans TaxID=161493 RepID=Q2IE78_ANADE|nr:acetate kinase [Anaeromyxobacter dehalogenans 2CP-C]